MNKQQASEQLKQLESEVAKLKAIIEAPEPKPAIAVSELSYGDNYFLCRPYGEVTDFNWGGEPFDKRMLSQGKIHLTRESAELEIKYNKLNQELRVAMAADWGDVEVDWGDNDQDKWIIEWYGNKTQCCFSYKDFQKIHFRTKEARDKFYKEHTEEELELLIKGLRYEWLTGRICLSVS